VKDDFCSLGKRFESLKLYLFNDHVLSVYVLDSSRDRSPVRKAIIITGFIFSEQAFNSFYSSSKDKILSLMYSFSENSLNLA
jgi:hypothetical protein